MKKETAANQPAEIDNVKLDLLSGFRRFFGEITTESLDSPPPTCESHSLPVAPLRPRKCSKIETSAEGRLSSPTESAQLNLEI
jgi:hypothetical protein